MADESRADWRKPKSPKELLANRDAPLDATSFYALLELAGMIEWQEYLSTTGSGEIKRFRRLNRAGLNYGINAPTAHEFRTECRFYAENFPDLLKIAAGALSRFASDLSAPGVNQSR